MNPLMLVLGSMLKGLGGAGKALGVSPLGAIGGEDKPKRRRRRLVTASQLRDLVAIKEILGRTAAATALSLLRGAR